MPADPSDLNSPHMRRAGKELLSLALMDARNHSLRWISVYEDKLAATGFRVPHLPELNPPLWMLGYIGWFQERWIARNVQRQRGSSCDPTAPRFAAVVPDADRWYDPEQSPHDGRWRLDLPDLQTIKQMLSDTMDITLELLESADENDDALYFFRLALLHEDMQGDQFARMAQTLDLGLGDARGLVSDIATQAPREALTFPASRMQLGSKPGGFVFDNEKWAHEVSVPEFEIDSQPVNWAQYVEFVEDGGYDEPTWWSADGWAWLQREGRRVPRHVHQMRQGVLQQRFGRLVRVPLPQPAMHVTAYEAEAWCRWAGRRLPTEVEWEAAVTAGASRGFRWGDACEWTATTFRPYPGFSADPWKAYSSPSFGTHRVLRGASFATRGRLCHPRFRRFELPACDDGFNGFRSCAV